jgi:hypothetical protein
VLVKKIMKYIKSYKLFEIINLPSSSVGGSVYWHLPLKTWTNDIPKSKFIKKWTIDNLLTGSFFEYNGDKIIFSNLKELNFDGLENIGKGVNEPVDIQLPKNFEEISKNLLDELNLGTPILLIYLKDYEDGVKVSVVSSNWKLIKNLGLRETALNLYKSFVRETGIPIYSDSGQTEDSKNKIWNKLLKDGNCEVVGWDQKSKKELTVKMINGNPVVNDKEYIYYGKNIEKPTEKEFQERQRRKERTRILKLKSVK